MGRPQVSIRLGTTGRGDVERDFVAIGDAGDVQARRYAAAWERASADVDRAIDRQAKAAARLSAVSATPVQQTINASTGVNAAPSGNAKAAAAALAAELERAESEARQLIAAIDPLFAAQARYTAQVERINAVKATGQLDEVRYQQLLAHEKVLLDEATAAGARNTVSRGQQRMGMQQLGFQLGDIATQYSMGTRASIIFAQQSGQTIQALQLMGGEGNKFLAFLRGPWGIALSVAAIALTPLIGKLLETGSAVDEEVEKLKKEAEQHRVSGDAQKAFAMTLDGVTDALRRNQEALDLQVKKEESAAKQALVNALAAKGHAEALRVETQALLANAEAQLAREKAMLTGVSSPQAREFAMQDMANAQEAVNRIRASLGETDKAIAQAETQIADATARVYQDAVLRDPVDKIKHHYQQLIDQARERGLAEHKTFVEIAKQTEALKLQRDAAIKAEQDKDRKGPANAGGTAIFNEQIASFFDIAARYRGMSETKDRLTLKTFLGDVDPEKTAWCAAFVNAVLTAGGVHGTGSLAAASFLNFGKDDTRSPQKGDVAVVKSKGSSSGEHVGFVQSIDKAGNVTVLGGNTGNKVGTAVFSAKDVLAIRRPPTPSESAAADDKAASAALQAQDTFDSERARLNEQLQRELAKVTAAYADQAAVQTRVAQAEHDAEAQAITTNLAQGKYGAATSELAQARARQLQLANDDLLKQRQASIAIAGFVKSLDDQQKVTDQHYQHQLDDLQGLMDEAKTAKERRALATQMVDILYEQKKYDLEVLKAKQIEAHEFAKAAETQAAINRLPQEKARDQRGAANDNKTPFEAYRDSLPSPDQAGDLTQGFLVDGLKQLNSGLDEALLKSKNFKELWHNIKGVFHDVAASILKDLIDLTIKMLIIRPIMNLITGAPAFATGTEYAPGGMAWVGEHGKELVQMPRGAKVFTASESRRMAAANDGGPSIGSISIAADFRGVDPDSVARIQTRLDQMERELPGKIVQTWADADDRFMFRGRNRR